MYQQELARSGKTLFKIRGHYLTAIVIVGAAIAYYSGAMGPFETEGANQLWFWVSLAIALAGALIRVITSGYAAPGTSGNSKDVPLAAELNTTGPYSLVRNPLYVGRILNFTGIAMLSGSWVYGVLVFLTAILVYERIAVFEEEFLRAQFPESHAAWAAEVPFLLPRLCCWLKSKYQFWVGRCIRRENKKLFWLANALILNDFARRGFDINQLPENPIWYYAWAVLVLTSLVVHLLRRFNTSFAAIS